MNREGLKEVLVNMQEGYKEMKEEFEDKVDVTLDTSGQNCPMPIIKTKKELKGMKIGQTIKLISTDPGAVGDIESLCNALKQALEKTIEEDDKFIFVIRKTTDIQDSCFLYIARVPGKGQSMKKTKRTDERYSKNPVNGKWETKEEYQRRLKSVDYPGRRK